MNIKHVIDKIRMYVLSPIAYGRSLGVKFGKGCRINTREFPPEGYLVEIGDYVRMARYASIFSHGGLFSLRKLKDDPALDQFGKVKIGDYSSIGAYAMIMPGVEIGKCCIIAAASVVTKSVPDGWMVAGNPARFIGYTEDYYRKVKEKYDVGSAKMTPKEKREYLTSLPDERFIHKPFMKLPEKSK